MRSVDYLMGEYIDKLPAKRATEEMAELSRIGAMWGEANFSPLGFMVAVARFEPERLPGVRRILHRRLEVEQGLGSLEAAIENFEQAVTKGADRNVTNPIECSEGGTPECYAQQLLGAGHPSWTPGQVVRTYADWVQCGVVGESFRGYVGRVTALRGSFLSGEVVSGMLRPPGVVLEEMRAVMGLGEGCLPPGALESLYHLWRREGPTRCVGLLEFCRGVRRRSEMLGDRGWDVTLVGWDQVYLRGSRGPSPLQRRVTALENQLVSALGRLEALEALLGGADPDVLLKYVREKQRRGQ